MLNLALVTAVTGLWNCTGFNTNIYWSVYISVGGGVGVLVNARFSEVNVSCINPSFYSISFKICVNAVTVLYYSPVYLQ